MSKNRSTHLFSRVPAPEIQRSIFDRSHGYKSTFDAGYLVPFYYDEVLPGDSFKIKATTFARLNTPIVPIMDNLYLDTFFFYVPFRLVWDNFQKFMGERKNPDDSIDYVIPTLKDNTVFSELSLGDYFGHPIGKKTVGVSALPFRAYNLIYNEWFRDENLINSVNVPTDDGKDDISNYSLLKRCKRHDYFTSALPWPQKGDSVDIPLGETAPLYAGSTFNDFYNSNSSHAYGLTYQSSSPYPVQLINTDVPLEGTGTTQLYADLSNATAATINSLRQAFQVQRMLEKDARSGSRYTEIIRGHFGVLSPDARLQRPEYIGGRSVPININPVVQTSSTDSVSPQGNLSAFGVCGSDTNVMSKSFTEHGMIIGLVNVRADLTYQQGLNRMWTRKTRYDFYWPSLAHLGEQTVLNREIYCQGHDVVDAYGNVIDDDVFGYQERYAEYRYYPSQITGRFRSTAAQPLDSWHLSQKFTSLPTLGQTFIEESPPMDRVVSVPSEPDILFDSWLDIKAARPMPLYSVPGLIDHF